MSRPELQRVLTILLFCTPHFRIAKDKKLRLWKDFQSSPQLLDVKEKNFQAKVSCLTVIVVFKSVVFCNCFTLLFKKSVCPYFYYFTGKRVMSRMSRRSVNVGLNRNYVRLHVISVVLIKL